MAVGLYEGSKINTAGDEETGRWMMRGRSPGGRLEQSDTYRAGREEKRVSPRRLSRNRGRGSRR